MENTLPSCGLGRIQPSCVCGPVLGVLDASLPGSVCSHSISHSHLAVPLPPSHALPLSPFAFPVHFFTYDREFISQYCQVSALLELESLLSQQSLREAFSDAELSTAKQRHQQVQDYIQVCGRRGAQWVGPALDWAAMPAFCSPCTGCPEGPVSIIRLPTLGWYDLAWISLCQLCIIYSSQAQNLKGI